MAQRIMQIVVILLIALVISCAGQNDTTTAVQPPPGNSSSNAAPTASTNRSFDFGFDCRRGLNSCANNGECDLKSGKCQCKGTGDFNYMCTNISRGAACNPPCEHGGICNNGVCVCTESYYGSNCSLPRAQVICHNDSMLVNINPMDKFEGLIYVRSHLSCSFTANATKIQDYGNFATDLKGFPGLNGWQRVLPFIDTECGNATVGNGAETYAREIYVQYVSLVKSAVDQIVTVRCQAASDNFTIYSEVSNIGDADDNLGTVNTGGKVEIVTLQINNDRGERITNSILLGAEIHLLFTLTVSSDSIFTDFQLLNCVANNTQPSPNDKRLEFLTSGCPVQEAKSFFAALPEKRTSTNARVIDVNLKAFMFVGSSTVAFACNVGLCTKANEANCQQNTCSGFSNDNAKASSNNTNSDEPSINGTSTIVTRRKRATEDTVKKEAQIKVIGPDGDENTESTDQDSTIQDCIKNPDVTAAFVILGVCLFLAMVVIGFLIFRLMKSKKKSSSAQPDRFPRPVETLRFPRLELNTSHNNGC